jgi:prophage regulatory protein
MPKYLRPKQAADTLGMSVPTLYRRAKDDPDFPQLISLGPNITVISEEEIEQYVAKKAAAGARQKETVTA